MNLRIFADPRHHHTLDRRKLEDMVLIPFFKISFEHQVILNLTRSYFTIKKGFVSKTILLIVLL